MTVLELHVVRGVRASYEIQEIANAVYLCVHEHLTAALGYEYHASPTYGANACLTLSNLEMFADPECVRVSRQTSLTDWSAKTQVQD